MRPPYKLLEVKTNRTSPLCGNRYGHQNTVPRTQRHKCICLICILFSCSYDWHNAFLFHDNHGEMLQYNTYRITIALKVETTDMLLLIS